MPRLARPPSDGEMYAVSLAENIGCAIDRAVDAERERCAKVADSVDAGRDTAAACVAKAIGVAIRSNQKR